MPMQLGFNYPWAFNKYGFYFGLHLEEPTLLSSPANSSFPLGNLDPLSEVPGEEMWMEQWLPEFLQRAIYLKTNLNVSVIRIFLMCNALNWGKTVDGVLIAPPYLHPRFIYHLETLLEHAAQAQVKLIPSLLDFGIDDPALGKKRRTAIISDPKLRQVFFSQVLDPMLQASKPFAKTIYAWEVMNEPSWLVSPFWPHSYFPRKRNVTYEQLKSFLREALDRIEAQGFGSTVGHRFSSDLSKYATGTLPQFHYYPKRIYPPKFIMASDERELPDARMPAITKTAFLGEFGVRPDQGDPWRELRGKDFDVSASVVERFRAAEGKHYPLALLWPDLSFDEANRLYPAAIDPLKLSPDADAGFRRLRTRTTAKR